MNYFHTTRRFFTVMIFLALIFTGCAQMKTGTSSSNIPVDRAAHKPVLEPSKQTSAQESIPIKRPHVTGDYQKTIDFYKSEQAKYPYDQTLTKDYAKNVDEMKDAADQEYEKEKYTSACKTYSILAKNYSAFKTFVHMLSFNRSDINKKLNDCKSILSKKGFQEYREGNLNEAIALWKGYLTIDPNYADIRKAVNTATLQQKNLQKK